MSKSQVVLNSQTAFRMFANRTEFKSAAGQEAPPYDPARKIKRWFDSNAGADGLPEVIYQNNIMSRPDGTFVLKNGAPVVRPLVLPVEEARTVNLPPEDPSGNTAIQPGWTEIPCPFRDLTQDEILVVAGAEAGFLSGKVIMIRNAKLFEVEQARLADESGKFTAADRAILKAIADKLGA
ncbi:MAG: hypothetical protein C0504_05180 [Candidatus Solibacter sp.]|nr:hypothetical protein [Candidatus Solibacter sp.]